MSFKDQQRYQDIAIINFEKCPPDEPKQREGNPYLQALVIFLGAALLVAIGYIACLKTGILAPPAEPCCFGILELDFDFNASTTDA